MGGYRRHLACQGQGGPTVVMEAAIGETGLLWSLVQPAIAGVPGPYVLVGHAFGGLLVRLYAARYPQEVAGLVLVDSAHEDQDRRAPTEIRELGPQFQEQPRQRFEGLKALMVSGALDPAVLPVPPGLPVAAAETFRALVVAGSKHVQTFLAEQQQEDPK